MAVGVIAKLRVQPGKGAELERVFGALSSEVRAREPDNRYYALHRSRTDAQLYVVMEQYADEAALAAHSASDYVKHWGPQLGAVLAAAPELEFFDAV